MVTRSISVSQREWSKPRDGCPSVPRIDQSAKTTAMHSAISRFRSHLRPSKCRKQQYRRTYLMRAAVHGTPHSRNKHETLSNKLHMANEIPSALTHAEGGESLLHHRRAAALARAPLRRRGAKAHSKFVKFAQVPSAVDVRPLSLCTQRSDDSQKRGFTEGKS